MSLSTSPQLGALSLGERSSCTARKSGALSRVWLLVYLPTSVTEAAGLGPRREVQMGKAGHL